MYLEKNHESISNRALTTLRVILENHILRKNDFKVRKVIFNITNIKSVFHFILNCSEIETV